MRVRTTFAIAAALCANGLAAAQTVADAPATPPASSAEAIADALNRLGNFTCVVDPPAEPRRRTYAVAKAAWQMKATVTQGWVSLSSSRQAMLYPEAQAQLTPEQYQKRMAEYLGRRATLNFKPGNVTAKVEPRSINYYQDAASGPCATILQIRVTCKVKEYRGDDADVCIVGREEWYPKDVGKTASALILFAPSTAAQDLNALVQLINASG